MEHNQYIHNTFRKEINYEQSLISQRMTWLLMIEAFLFTTFAISLSNGAIKSFWWLTFLVIPAAGIIVSYVGMIAIKAAIETIQFWHKKQTAFFQEDSNKIYEVLDLDKREGHIHFVSMLFPQRVPIFFIILWLFLGILGCLQVWKQFIPVIP
ncbi:MAG: hypothetical protein D3926_13385 [Desulfobacteraceae bacterium]|nr:MAG: hypothetical protein D3926_13385 [Desulfobacteraceae bacterium]